MMNCKKNTKSEEVVKRMWLSCELSPMNSILCLCWQLHRLLTNVLNVLHKRIRLQT